MALDAFAYAIQKSNKKNLRFRIEHDQVVAPEDFKKYKDLGVIASVQPNHLLTDMNWAEAHIGPGRTKDPFRKDTDIAPAKPPGQSSADQSVANRVIIPVPQ